MRLANLAAFKRYAANLEKHRIPLCDRLVRLERSLDQSGIFLSSNEFRRCANFVADYGDEGE